tara:strand:+ start:200 stop:736 length:537 start_codon:yes stop_codon:yes gene_type:complete
MNLLITIITILIFIILIPISYFFIIPFFFGAPYDVTRKEALENIMKLTKPKEADLIAELGSGDGRVCIALAQKGAIVHGFEINPFLVWYSRRKIRKLNLQNKIKIYWRSFWKVNFQRYNKAVMFQFSTIIGKIAQKLRSEMNKGSIIISHNWKVPNQKVKQELGQQKLTLGKIYLYEV